MHLGNTFRIATVGSVVIMLVTIDAQEKKITRRDLPALVEKTVAMESRGAAIKGFSTEIDNGKKVYEVRLMVAAHGRDLMIDEEGQVLEVEEEVAFAALPAGVRQGLAKEAGTGRMGKVESLTKRGKLVAYETVVKRGAKQIEIQVGPDGKKLAYPE